MSDLENHVVTMELLKESYAHFSEWVPKMKVTLVSYSDEEVFQAFQAGYYAEHGEHLCYTLSDWLSLDTAAKSMMVGQNVMLIKPRSELIGISGGLLFAVKRYYRQAGKDFITIRDQLGLSGTRYIPSHSY